MDYNPNHDPDNGQFAEGATGKSSTPKKKSGKIKSTKAKMSRKEFARVSSGILTDHPKLKPGTERIYEYGNYQYRVIVKGPGDYDFKSKRRLK